MTDMLLQKVEEKVMTLVAELEDLRKEMHKVKQENAFLKADKVNQSQKLQELISLLDTLDTVQEATHIHEHNFSHARLDEAVAQ